MYLPKHFEESDIGVMHALMRSHPLGAWVMTGTDGLTANHIPFQLAAERGTYGTLIGHVARANAAWRSLSSEKDSLVIFQGPDAYITPSWYPGKEIHGKVVPTWNYAVVHAYGVARAVDDRPWLLRHLSQLSDIHESSRAKPWKLSDAPEAFVADLASAVVGIEIPITRLTGKWKVSQNRPDADKQRVVDALLADGDDASREMAALVRRHLPQADES